LDNESEWNVRCQAREERVICRGMDLRLRNLEQLDSRAVPLPHGTEVVTRVDRIVGERRVPQGSVGRVTKAEGDALDITIVGVADQRGRRSRMAARGTAGAL
jgi:hypothetical protein